MRAVDKAIREYLERHRPLGLVSAYLFGSEGRGTAHRDSDVDIGIVLDPRTVSGPAERARVMERLATELIAVTHRNEVDVVSLTDAPPELAAAVVTSGQRLNCPDPEGDHEFVRNALLRYGDIRPFLERMRRTKLLTLAR